MNWRANAPPDREGFRESCTAWVYTRLFGDQSPPLPGTLSRLAQAGQRMRSTPAEFNPIKDRQKGLIMSISRRHFFYGSLLAGAVPAAGFGSTANLKFMGYKSPNEKLNFAAIGSGGQGASNLSAAAPTENIVALADVDD